jgi:hypothetical protein
MRGGIGYLGLSAVPTGRLEASEGLGRLYQCSATTSH